MRDISEGDICITLPKYARFRKFDDVSHRLSHCMKAVDFIIKAKRQTYFIEIKDPQHPEATIEKQEKFIKELRNNKKIADFAKKYRDSFLYELASGNPVYSIDYIVLICLNSLDNALLITLTDALKRELPVNGPDGASWKRPFVRNCFVMNLDTWNKYLPQFPAYRQSEL